MRGPLLHPTMKMRPVEAGMRPATAVLSCGARDGVSLGCSRPCALACLGMRRATAAGGPQRYRRRRNSIGAGRCSAAPSGLPRVPPMRCSSGSSRSPASARRGPLRSPPRLRPRSVGDRRRSSRSSRAPRPAGPHLARPGALGGSPPFCRGIRSGRAGIVAALLSRRPVARCALLPPVSRPARARELARALAALFFVQLLYLSARILFLSAFCG